MSDSKKTSFLSHLAAAFRGSNVTSVSDSSNAKMPTQTEVKEDVIPMQEYNVDKVIQQTPQCPADYQPNLSCTNPYQQNSSESYMTEHNFNEIQINKELHEKIMDKIKQIKIEKDEEKDEANAHENLKQAENCKMITTEVSSVTSRNEDFVNDISKNIINNKNNVNSTFLYIVDYKKTHGIDISIEEILANCYITLQTSLEAVGNISKKISLLKNTPTDIHSLKEELGNLKLTLENFKTKGNSRMTYKIDAALISLSSCSDMLEKLPVKTEKSAVASSIKDNNPTVQMEISNIVMNILLAQQKARESMQNVKSELDKQLSLYKTMLEYLNISANHDPQLAQAHGAALELCTSNTVCMSSDKL